MSGVCFIMFALTYPLAQSSDTEQLNIENQGGIRWNHAASPLCTITELGRNGQLSLPSHFHTLDALVPSLDDASGTQRKRKRLASVHGTVEFLPIFQPACVMHSDGLSRLCNRA